MLERRLLGKTSYTFGTNYDRQVLDMPYQDIYGEYNTTRRVVLNEPCTRIYVRHCLNYGQEQYDDDSYVAVVGYDESGNRQWTFTEYPNKTYTRLVNSVNAFTADNPCYMIEYNPGANNITSIEINYPI